MHAIVNAIAAEKSEAEGLKVAMRAAHVAGDPEGVADITMKLGEIGSRLASLNDGKAQLDAYIRNPARAAPPKPPAQADRRRPPQQPAAHDDLDDGPAADPIEAYIGRQTPRVQQYLRTRDAKGWLADPRSSSRLAAAHHSALSEGYVEESPGYFAFIDDKMGVAKVDNSANGGTKKPAPKQGKATVPAAPVSAKASAAPTNGVTNNRVVTLTAAQQDAARSLNLTNAEYAKRVWAMKQPGYGGPKFGGN